jgi:hypothetical protein
MLDSGTLLYFFAVVGGALILGLAIAYGFMRSKQRTQREKLAAERGAHEVYEKEDRAPGP